jgi:hypothetical protein
MPDARGTAVITRDDDAACWEPQFEVDAGEAVPGQFFLIDQDQMGMFLDSRRHRQVPHQRSE